MNRRLAVLLPTIALAAAVACGSSSSGNGNTGAQNEDGGSSSGSSGSSGSSSSGGGSAMTGDNDSGTSSSAPVVCGGTMCSAPSGIIPLAACCQSDNTCGATFSASGLGGALGGAGGGAMLPSDAGLPCLDTSAGTTDSTCPSQMVMNFMLAGCCTRSGVCGTDLSMLGLGCNSVSALFGGAGGGTPQACGGDGSAPISDAAPTSDAAPSDATPE